jgi:O-antigen/teichoic acid export membrane protein
LKVEIEQFETIETVASSETAPDQSSRFSSLARDIATMGGGTALAALFNTLLVFLVPRLVSVEDFGYWRLFLLYAGYAGMLHLGFADGALLRWAGRPLEDFRHEIGPSMKFLLWQHLAVIVPACLLVALLLPSPAKSIGIAVLVFALIMNAATLLQNGLQAARQFKAVAIAAVAPAGAFVLLAFVWSMRRTPNYRELIVLYCGAWVAVLVYLWFRLGPQPSSALASPWSLGKMGILMGWPIVLANCGLGLVQSADRVVVSAALPIHDFAQYSLAVSTMFVPVAAIAAVYRVFFSHVAAVEHEGRARVYAHASKFLLIAWSLLLPYFFVLEVFVRGFIPKYVPSLPLAGILLLGVIFLAGIQILHMSFAYLHGKQRQFLFLTVVALTLSISLGLVTAVWLRSLVAVAAGQVVALGFWWLMNEWKLRKTTGQRWQDWFRVLSVVGWSAASYVLTLWFTPYARWRAPMYYLLVIFVLWFSCREEFRFCWRLLRPTAVSLD